MFWPALRHPHVTRFGKSAESLDSPAAAHQAVRGMIGRALRDPYTKFISPQVRCPCHDDSELLSVDTLEAAIGQGRSTRFSIFTRHTCCGCRISRT